MGPVSASCNLRWGVRIRLVGVGVVLGLSGGLVNGQDLVGGSDRLAGTLLDDRCLGGGRHQRLEPK